MTIYLPTGRPMTEEESAKFKDRCASQQARREIFWCDVVISADQQASQRQKIESADYALKEFDKRFVNTEVG
jgi:hypothetical protein